MDIFVNGKRLTLQDSLPLKELLAGRDLAPQRVVVEINRQIIDRERFDDTILAAGDNVEILRFVGGG